MRKKRLPFRFLALFVPACTVDTPVVQGEDDRLGEGLVAWCETFCTKINGCAMDAGEDGDPGCPDTCNEMFARFAGKSELCTESGLRLMDCWDRASCQGVLDDTCGFTEALGRCDASVGQLTCASPRVGNGAATTPASPCQVIYDECSNGRFYELTCGGPGPGQCECAIDAYPTGRFYYRGQGCPEPFEARQACGWPITPEVGEPPTPQTVSCTFGSTSGAAGGGSAGDCEIFLEGCSDGKNYGIICDESASSLCTCRVDGEQVGDLVLPHTICPYVFESDGGSATLNHACGFSITPPLLQ